MKTQFNPNNKERLTYGEALEPAMKITDQEDANQYKADYIAFQIKMGASEERAEYVVNTNLGYYAGYFSEEVRERVERLFKTQHPYFGKISINGAPSSGTAFQIGQTIVGKK